MTAAPDRLVWLFAGAASLALHGGLVATLLLFPAPHRAQRTETSIAFQSVPAQLPDGVRSGAALAPVRSEPTATLQDSVLKRMVEPRADKAGSETLSPVERSTYALAPADTGKVAASPASEQRLAGAAEAERVVVEAKAKAERNAEPVAHPDFWLPPSDLRSKTYTPADAGPSVAVSAEQPSRLVDPFVEKATADAVDAKALPTVLAPAASSSAQVPSAGYSPSAERPAVSVARQPNFMAARAGNMPAAMAVPTGTSLAAAPPPAGQSVQPGAASTSGKVMAAAEGNVAAAKMASAPVAVAPISITDSPGLQTAQPGEPAPMTTTASGELLPVIERVEPLQSAKAVALVTPPKPPTRMREIDPYSRVLEYIAGYRGSECFLALPSLGNKAPIEIDGFAVGQEETARFTKELIQLTGIAVEPSSHAISPNQCDALAFARKLSSYPKPALDLRLNARGIRSGTLLSGTIEQLRRKMLYLIVIDDDGKVQEIQNLYRSGEGDIAFEAPMTLTQGRVETVQLLIAIASDNALDTFASHEGEHATDYFAALAEEIAKAGVGIDFGFTYFVVR